MASMGSRPTSISRSFDNSVLYLSTAAHPLGSLVTVVLTDGVRDLSGNPMEEFQSSYRVTTTGTDTGRPSS